MYIILKWLTFLWYVVHVCSRSFPSPYIHCILCFMWLGFSHLFSYKCMYVGGINFTSLLFMNAYSIYTFIVWFMQKRRKILFMPFYCLYPFVDELIKRGEIFWSLRYACLFICMLHVCLYACLFKFDIFYLWYQEHLLLASRVFIGIKSNIF